MCSVTVREARQALFKKAGDSNIETLRHNSLTMVARFPAGPGRAAAYRAGAELYASQGI